MHVKQFAEQVASMAKEIGCDGGTWVSSHKFPSSVTLDVEDSDAEFELVRLDPDRALGCGCWIGIRIVIRPSPVPLPSEEPKK